MSVRISLCSCALVLLGGWLAVSMVTLQRQVRFVLEVPATTISVEQVIEPRLVNLDDADATIALQWSGASGPAQSAVVQLAAGAELEAFPVSPARVGGYRLQAEQVDAPHPELTRQTVRVQAVAEPPPRYGGVLDLDAAGLAGGTIDYLRAHGFVVNDLDLGRSNGFTANLPPTALIVIGDARLAGAGIAGEYRQIWSAVANGANLLLLEPPPPGVAAFWPLTWRPAPPGVAPDLFPVVPPRLPALSSGIAAPAQLAALLPPRVRYQVGPGSGAPDIYDLAGTQLFHGDAPALFIFRYGDGWVTVSELPLLEHFQDTRVRWYLMNLLKVADARQRRQSPAPGLQWVMEHRLQQLSRQASPAWTLAAYEVPPPAAGLEPEPELAPALSDGDRSTCVIEPQLMGGELRAQVTDSAGLTGWAVFANVWPTAWTAAASSDGVHWLPMPPAPAEGADPLRREWSLPASPQRLRWFRLRITADAPGHAWSVCEIQPLLR